MCNLWLINEEIVNHTCFLNVRYFLGPFFDEKGKMYEKVSSDGIKWFERFLLPTKMKHFSETTEDDTEPINSNDISLHHRLIHKADQSQTMAIFTNSMSATVFFCDHERGPNLGTIQTMAIR